MTDKQSEPQRKPGELTAMDKARNAIFDLWCMGCPRECWTEEDGCEHYPKGVLADGDRSSCDGLKELNAAINLLLIAHYNFVPSDHAEAIAALEGVKAACVEKRGGHKRTIEANELNLISNRAYKDSASRAYAINDLRDAETIINAELADLRGGVGDK